MNYIMAVSFICELVGVHGENHLPQKADTLYIQNRIEDISL